MSWLVFSTVNVCYNQSTSSDTLLLSKVRSLFRFLSFYLTCFLCAGISSRTLHTVSCHVSLGASRLWQFLCLVLLLMILKVFRSTSHMYCRIALYGICLIFFLLSNWDSGLGGGREIMVGQCPCIISCSYGIRSMWFMNMDMGLDHWTEGLLVRFRYGEVTPSSWLCFLEGNHCAQPMLKESGVRSAHKELWRLNLLRNE